MAYFGGQVESHVASCRGTVSSYQFWASLAKVPVCPLTSVTMHVPGVQDCPPLPASFLQESSSSFSFHPPSFWDHFFLATFIFHPFFFLGPQTPQFSQSKQSMC